MKSLAQVRNPVLDLPGIAELKALAPVQRGAVVRVLESLSKDARLRADNSWKRHKAPMACYWKAVAVYARHIARAIK